MKEGGRKKRRQAGGERGMRELEGGVRKEERRRESDMEGRKEIRKK